MSRFKTGQIRTGVAKNLATPRWQGAANRLSKDDTPNTTYGLTRTVSSKTSSAELSEAINSMFCLVALVDSENLLCLSREMSLCQPLRIL